MKQIIPSNLWNIVTDKFQNLVPPKYRKWAIATLALVLVLIIVLVGCLSKDAPAEDALTCTVSADNLNVHKNYDPDSSILAQLPLDLEIRILEQKTANGMQWGRIEQMKLADGTKIKAGWINLEYVTFPGEEEPEIIETEPPVPETEPVTVILPDPEQGITTMGTVTTGKLHVRKGAGSQYESFDSYLEGDRIEIQEIVTVDDTQWGFTGKGWVGMGYVRLDGTAITYSGEDAPAITSDGNLKVLGYGVVDLGSLNVRLGPSLGYEKTTTVSKGARYAYYQEQDGWVRIESGWVSTEYFYVEGTHSDDAVNATVNTDDLNIRTGPGTSFKSNGTVKKGDTVDILGQVGNWGYTSSGWINMANLDINDPIYSTGTGTVTRGLNIRKEPDADSELVDAYKKDDRVTILEVQGTWGRTDKGWINLKFVNFD